MRAWPKKKLRQVLRQSVRACQLEALVYVLGLAGSFLYLPEDYVDAVDRWADLNSMDILRHLLCS